MIHLPRVLAAAGEVQQFCRERKWPFCFIGGVAVQRWGEPRLTQDVDLTLLTGFNLGLGGTAILDHVLGQDLIVHKVFAGRDLDWGDVERVLVRQHGKLNMAQIRTELKPLLELKGEPESLDKLERKIATVEQRLRAKP